MFKLLFIKLKPYVREKKTLDDAIVDGVDIITISLGLDSAIYFVLNEIAVGSFHSMKKEIFTVNFVGNSAPSPSTVTLVAQWLFYVAASTIDSRFINKVLLRNGKTLTVCIMDSFHIA